MVSNIWSDEFKVYNHLHRQRCPTFWHRSMMSHKTLRAFDIWDAFSLWAAGWTCLIYLHRNTMSNSPHWPSILAKVALWIQRLVETERILSSSINGTVNLEFLSLLPKFMPNLWIPIHHTLNPCPSPGIQLTEWSNLQVFTPLLLSSLPRQHPSLPPARDHILSQQGKVINIFFLFQ